jgi:hypothetical protein
MRKQFDTEKQAQKAFENCNGVLNNTRVELRDSENELVRIKFVFVEGKAYQMHGKGLVA